MRPSRTLTLLSKYRNNVRRNGNGNSRARRRHCLSAAARPAILECHAELLEERLLLAAHPVISAPATATVVEDSSLTFSKANGNAISVVYSSAAEPFMFSIGATNGTVTFKDTTGLTFNNGTTNGANAVSVVGTPTTINAALGAGVVYQPNNGFTGSDTLKLSAENGLVTSKGTATISVTVTSPPPSIAVPLPSTVLEDNYLNFGTSTNNPFNVQDIAGTGNNVDSMNLSVSHGTFTIYNTANLLILGNDTSSIAAVGTAANLNEMLNGFAYTPTVGFNGSDSLTVTVKDSIDKESASKTATIYVTHWSDMTTASLTSEQNSGAQGANFEMLLPNGDLMVQGGVNTPTTSWYEITPQNGSYANGTWSQLGSMNQARLFFSSDVLPNGDVFVFGGEFASDGAVWIANGNYVAPGTPGATQQYSPSAEIYDPTTNIWYQVQSEPALYTITNYLNQTQNVAMGGDQPSEVLPDGDVLVGNTFNSGTEIYVPQFGALGIPGNGNWEAGPTKQYSEGGEQSNEESWVKLGNGDILTYNIYSSYFDGVGEAELYVPSTTGGIGQWETASSGDLPVLTAPVDGANEIGPALLLPNGDAFFGGPTGLTAFYDPKTDTWSQGPNLPQTLVSNGEGHLVLTQLGMDDGPGAVLPNGDLLLALSPTDTEPNYPTEIAPGPTVIVEFNPTTQIFTYVTPSPSSIDLTGNSFVNSMLVLPNGQVLLTNDGPNLTFYNLPGGDDPQASWRPTITSFKQNSNGSSYTLTGTQINGLDEGAAYGDDEQMAENYPIVRLRNLGTDTDYYATTSNWSSNWVATGSTPETVNVVLPTLPAGTYQLVVIANGINSEPITFTVPMASRRPAGAGASAANADQLAGAAAPAALDSETNSTSDRVAPTATSIFGPSLDSSLDNPTPAIDSQTSPNAAPLNEAFSNDESLQWAALNAAIDILGS